MRKYITFLTTPFHFGKSKPEVAMEGNTYSVMSSFFLVQTTVLEKLLQVFFFLPLSLLTFSLLIQIHIWISKKLLCDNIHCYKSYLNETELK